MDGNSGDLRQGGEHCTVLLSDLPPDWFHLGESAKRDMFGPEVNVLKESCCDAANRTAVMRVKRKTGQEPALTCRDAKATVIISDEKTTLSMTLNDSSHCKIVEDIASTLNLQFKCTSTYFYSLTGNLESIIDFRKVFDAKVMSSKGPLADIDGAKSSSDRGSHDVTTLSSASSNFPGPDSEKLQDRFNPNVLVLMKSMKESKIHGVYYNLQDGSVFIDGAIKDRESIKERFYALYDKTVQKLKVDTFKIPSNVPLSVFKKELESLKQQHDQCAFLVMKDTQEVKLVSTSSRQLDAFTAKLKDKCSMLSFSMPSGRVFTLKKGDIVKEQVDIIVNAANGKLEHGGGVALAIDQASNSQVQLYSKEYMRQRKYKDIKTGNVAITGAGGALRCRNIIHAVGPTKHDHDCKGYLNSLVRNILKEAEKLDALSIAIPAISSGIYGVNKDLVAQCLFESIMNYKFTKPLTVLGDIRIVIIDQPTYDCFYSYMSKRVPCKDSSKSSGNDNRHSISSVQSGSDPSGASYASSVTGVARKDGGGLGDGKHGGSGGKHGGGKHGGGGGKRGGGNEGGQQGDGIGGGIGGVGDERKNNTSGFGGSGDDRHSVVGGKRDGSDDGIKKDCGVEGEERTPHTNTPNHAFGSETTPATSSGITPATSYGTTPATSSGITPATSSGTTPATSSGTTPATSSGTNSTTSSGISPTISSGTTPATSSGTTSATSFGTTPAMSSGTNPATSSGTNPATSSGTTSAASFGTTPATRSLQQETPSLTPPPGLTPLSVGSSGMNPNAPVYPSCLICFGAPPNDPIDICKRGHYYCKSCANMTFGYFPYCYGCTSEVPLPYSVPPNGTIKIYAIIMDLQGYSGYGSIVIEYNVPNILNDSGHISCRGLALRTYLPNNDEGKEVARLFEKQFENKLTFTILEDGHSHRVTCTHLYHKTQVSGGGLCGYPDPDYLQQVKEFLTRRSQFL